MRDNPTKAKTARSNALFLKVGRMKIARINQNNKDKAHAVWVAAIEIGAEKASSKSEACCARSICFVNFDEFSIERISAGQSSVHTIN